MRLKMYSRVIDQRWPNTRANNTDIHNLAQLSWLFYRIHSAGRMRDPRKIIITERGRERREDRFARDGQINIARCVARKSRTLQICRSVIASWYARDKRSDTHANRGVAREHSYWAVKYDLSINNVDRRRRRVRDKRDNKPDRRGESRDSNRLNERLLPRNDKTRRFHSLPHTFAPHLLSSLVLPFLAVFIPSPYRRVIDPSRHDAWGYKNNCRTLSVSRAWK